MNSLSLELVDDCHIYISGEVVVHPSAAIAPGVLLQADPGSRLTIAAGVCIGQGAVLHAHQGILAIEAGATLGSGVLIVGRGTIGSNSCVGAFTTVIDGSIKSNQSVPTYSLIGDVSRQVTLEGQVTAENVPADEVSFGPPTEEATSEIPSPSQPDAAQANTAQSSTAKSEAPAPKTMAQIYGQAYLERIMITMFPHRQPLDDSSPPESPP